jgi:hypothetical protein
MSKLNYEILKPQWREINTILKRIKQHKKP